MDGWTTQEHDASGHAYVGHEVIGMSHNFQLQLHDFYAIFRREYAETVVETVKSLNCVTLVNLPYILEALKH